MWSPSTKITRDLTKRKTGRSKTCLCSSCRFIFCSGSRPSIFMCVLMQRDARQGEVSHGDGGGSCEIRSAASGSQSAVAETWPWDCSSRRWTSDVAVGMDRWREHSCDCKGGCRGQLDLRALQEPTYKFISLSLMHLHGNHLSLSLFEY